MNYNLYEYETELRGIIKEFELKFEYLNRMKYTKPEIKDDLKDPNIYSVSYKQDFEYENIFDENNKNVNFTVALTTIRNKNDDLKSRLIETWTYGNIHGAYGYNGEGKLIMKDYGGFKYIDDIDYFNHYIKKTANIIFYLDGCINKIKRILQE